MKWKFLAIITVGVLICSSSGVIGLKNNVSSIRIDKATGDAPQLKKLTFPSTNSEEKEYIPGEVLIKFKNAGEMEQFIAEHKSREIQQYENINTVLVTVEKGEETQFVEQVNQDENVAYVERNQVLHAFFTPNDQFWNQQWGPQRIKCEEAWDITRGKKSVTVAIVDTGVDYNHEDIKDNYVTGGRDFIDNDDDPMDEEGHGTHCAGIATAVSNNRIGIAGVAQVSIMAERVLDEDGWGSIASVSSGITHAVDNGADIISLSLGGGGSSQTLKDACEYAWDNDVVVAAASGNDYDSSVCYPAAYNCVIAVGALTSSDEQCDFSNYGDNLELMAPGSAILSSIPNDEYEYFGGTSMACPHVAGVAALAKSRFPDYTNQRIREMMQNSADDLGDPGRDIYFGYGRVDALLDETHDQDNPLVNVKIRQVDEIDDIDAFGDLNKPEWYYKITAEYNGKSKSEVNYNGRDKKDDDPYFIWEWNHESSWSPNKEHEFEVSHPEATIKMKLMEHDFLLEMGMDDLADVSAYPGGGTDQSTADKRGAIYHGTYNLMTDELSGDDITKPYTYYKTSGSDDGSNDEDENDASIRFEISDTYNYEFYKPDLRLSTYNINIGETPKGEVVTRTFTVENDADRDPYGWAEDLEWQIDQKPSWLSVSTSSGTLSGGEDQDVTVRIDTGDMEKKGYNGNIQVTSNGGDNKIRVSITVPHTIDTSYDGSAWWLFNWLPSSFFS